jgi:Ser/Thr protein kinase RdoA (MazF antagonist)
MSTQPAYTPDFGAAPTLTDIPYRGLTPDVVLDALDSVSMRGDGRLIQLNSYENRVFQVFLEDGTVVVAKFYRPGRWTDAQILEEHAFSLELAAQEIPVIAPLALTPSPDFGSDVKLSASQEGRFNDIHTLATLPTADGDLRFAVMPRCSGQAPELDNDDTLRRIGRFMGRLHAVGKQRPFLHRRTLSVNTVGEAARDWLVAHDSVPMEVSSTWLSTVNEVLIEAQRAFDEAAPTASIRLHGDCHPGNTLWTPAGPHFVDMDDAVQGPAIQDLWMLLSGDAAAMSRQLSVVLSGYTDFMDLDPRELKLIEALRSLRMIHHSAWLAQRWNDPAFPIAFPWFGGVSYWQQQVTQLREQLELM